MRDTASSINLLQGILKDEASAQLKAFFKSRRATKKLKK